MMSKPTSGDIVTIQYKLEADGDFVAEPLFDQGRVSFVLDGGNYLPGLHKLVSGLEIGEKRSNVSLDAGWGDKREDLIAKVPLESSGVSPSDLKLGMKLFLANGMECRVIEVDHDSDPATFTIDANPPMAGSNYNAEVVLETFQSGPRDELFQFSSKEITNDIKYDVLTVALGCFWGGELEYQRVHGVVGTSVGYTQGQKDEPTYKEVCSGQTGHTEAIQVIFDSSIVSYEELVKIGLERLGSSRELKNQVGNDRGTQYRHGIYYHNDKQKDTATSVIGSYGKKCVTECLQAMKFFKAEDYHQQYLLKGGQSARKGTSETIRCYG